MDSMVKLRRACVGLDLSLTCAGVAALVPSDNGVGHDSFSIQWNEKGESESPSGKTASLSDAQRIRRLCAIRDRVVSYVHSIALNLPQRPLVCIEGYAFSRHSSSVTGLAELGGAVRCALVDKNLGVPVTLPVTQCRRFVTGSGKVTKKGVEGYLKKQGLSFLTNDEADAYVVGLTGYYLANAGPRAALDQTRLDYLDGILKTVLRRHPELRE